MLEEEKKYYIRLLNEANVHKLYIKELSEFVLTYNGTNKSEFIKLILSLIEILNAYNKAIIGDKAFYSLKNLNKKLKLQTQILREKYKNTYFNIMPLDTPILADEIKKSKSNENNINIDSSVNNLENTDTKDTSY